MSTGCRVCNSSSNLRKCTGCADAVYCSKTCQKTAWPLHKDLCFRLSPEPQQRLSASRKDGIPFTIPTRPIHIDGVRITHPSPTGHPTAACLLYHGILGHPDEEESESFRLFVNISKEDLSLLDQYSLDSEYDKFVGSIHFFKTVTPVITEASKKDWACVACGKKEKIRFHHTTKCYRPQVPGMMVGFWDNVLPICDDNKEPNGCFGQLWKVRKHRCETERWGAQDEARESYRKGLEKYFE